MTESDNNPIEGQGGNPAWEEFYNAIPENYREEVQPLINPVLEKWDRGVQQRFESYKPFEKYVNDKIDPQVVDYAMNLLDTLNDNDGALEVFNQLGSYLEGQGLLGQEEGEGNNQPAEEVDWSQVPPAIRQQIEQLQSSFGTLAEHQLMTQQQRIEAEEDEALDRELTQLREKHGDYDEDWVLAKMVNGMSAEEAVTSYVSWLDNTLKERNRPKPFNVMGSGSSEFPTGNGNFNPKKASAREVTDMITQKLMDLQRDR
jgi:hypothetical protein